MFIHNSTGYIYNSPFVSNDSKFLMMLIISELDKDIIFKSGAKNLIIYCENRTVIQDIINCDMISKQVYSVVFNLTDSFRNFTESVNKMLCKVFNSKISIARSVTKDLGFSERIFFKCNRLYKLKCAAYCDQLFMFKQCKLFQEFKQYVNNLPETGLESVPVGVAHLKKKRCIENEIIKKIKIEIKVSN